MLPEALPCPAVSFLRRFVVSSALQLFLLWPFAAVLLLAQQQLPVPLQFGHGRRWSAFGLGVQNGLSSFPIFGHRFPPAEASSVPSFFGRPFPSYGEAPIGYTGHFSTNPNFNTMPFQGFFPPPPIGGSYSAQFTTNQFLRESIFDRENFQARGCGWEPNRQKCIDLLGICKGGCEDFSLSSVSLRDCRCVPFAYSALLMGK